MMDAVAHELDLGTGVVEVADPRRHAAHRQHDRQPEPLAEPDVGREPGLADDQALIVDDVDLAAIDDVVVIVVPGLDVRPQRRQAEQDLPCRELLIIDLPDREVGIASTRSSTAGADDPEIDGTEPDERDEQRGSAKRHAANHTATAARSRRACTFEPVTGLARIVGVPGAVVMGLGSIVGSGLFVSVALAATIAGPSVIVAVALAAVLAVFNGLSSAQLAASHPVSGGTYEYGYRYLNPTLGFVAGWLFLCAKSASAATAALGFAHYTLAALGLGARLAIPVGVALVAIVTALVAGGLRRSHRTNTVIVAITLVALAIFVAAGAGSIRVANLAGALAVEPEPLLHATALVFVAYTGYGRIATLGEEVRDPARTIPRAMIVTLAATLFLYMAVTVVAVGTVGAAGLATAAPLEAVAVRHVVAVAAITAMIGVLLNLLLGLSRVVLAMARRADLPPALAVVRGESPRRATIATGVVIAGLVLVGDVHATWSFSAFTVLVYYALTNVAALRLPPAHRRYPRWLAGAGLVSCLGLAFWVEPRVWLVGLGVIAIGLVGRLVVRDRFVGRS